MMLLNSYHEKRIVLMGYDTTENNLLFLVFRLNEKFTQCFQIYLSKVHKLLINNIVL